MTEIELLNEMSLKMDTTYELLEKIYQFLEVFGTSVLMILAFIIATQLTKLFIKGWQNNGF